MPSTCRRIGAALIDFAILLVIICAAAVVFAGAEYPDPQPYQTVNLFPPWTHRLPPLVGTVLGCFVIAFVPLSIEFGPTAFFGRTFGKCVFGIQIVRRGADSVFNTRALFRALVKWSYLYGGICLPYLLTTSAKYKGPGQRDYEFWFIPEEWGPSIANIVFTFEFQIAIIIFNIVMLVLILGLHRKDRLGIHDQIVGTRLVRSDC